MTDAELLTRYVQAGVLSVNEARRRLDLRPFSGDFADWLPTPKVIPKLCSYCKAKSDTGNCKNCGAPA